ncbi:DUF58 domain-containing protein [Nocardioides mesophilus]|uniref:DUF58 domain-containing protein n=1 Tax=Nocardioides mesophilus TaxID=433659 RepID=A0A7G9RBX5_9ACTN|nr:DUF58 domain-containing protein [Nocardioides mesophilus]QNN53100.1 DUF58 domain-containing protein [Nocardioides mesophilus]
MREALSALTTRGRAFLAAGATALVCAVLLGYDELVRVGALLVAVPLVTAWFLGRSRYRLGLVRTVSPPQVVAGQQTRVTLDLTNDGRMPTGLLLLEDQIPYVLGTRPRFVIDRMGPRWKRTVSYVVRSEVRGKFLIGPMKVRLSDPFGMVELDRTFQTTSSLVVTPRVTPLPPIPLSGAWTGSGDNRPRAFASGSAEDVTVREYRRGDDLRRVHWRSSAHAGELMVRREEQPWQSRATLFLDNRKIAHRGTGAGSSLEHAVALAASIGVHLIQRGFSVRLVTAGGDEGARLWHQHGSLAAETGPLLESLAVVTELGRPGLDVAWLQEGGHSGLLVAVLGAVGDHDRATLTRMRHSAANAMAVALDVSAWNRGPGGSTDAVPWLGAHGWRAVPAGPKEPIPTVWQDLGLLARTGRTARQSPHSTEFVS